LLLQKWVAKVEGSVTSVDPVVARNRTAFKHSRVCSIRRIICNFPQMQAADIHCLEWRTDVEVIHFIISVQVGNADAGHCT
jgi:hypothetical protein